jgi:hypothetical protein
MLLPSDDEEALFCTVPEAVEVAVAAEELPLLDVLLLLFVSLALTSLMLPSLSDMMTPFWLAPVYPSSHLVNCLNHCKN